MVSTFTPNVGFELPARGDYVGTWDTPVNANETLADLILGGQTTISGAAGSVVLSAAQFSAKTITFNSTLLASIVITFPTSFMKSYEIFNTCTGSSAFVITLQTTAAAAGYVCAPPGEIVEIVNIGGQIRFKNLGRVGSYWDYGGSSVPAWVSGSNPVPYLQCDGGSFSSASFPQLATILGSTTLPNSHGRVRAALDGGTGRLSSAVAGFNPNIVGAAGGDQNFAQHNHNIFITDPGHTHATTPASPAVIVSGGPSTLAAGSNNTTPLTINSAFTGISATSSAAGTGTSGNVQPTYIGGIVMIRAG
jgi:hypothetical protein